MYIPWWDSQKLDFLNYLNTVFPPDPFETFLCGSTFDIATFCLQEKEGMFVNVECVALSTIN